MFGILFKQKNINRARAKELYACALGNSRKETFYTKYKVPDSFDGRFDLLVLHLFIIIHRIINQDNGEKLSQEIFDIAFKDINQSLREMGIGDVGIPKHMKKMMKAFNGRMHSYQSSYSDNNLKSALARNIYGASSENDVVEKDALNMLCLFVQDNLVRNNKADISFLMSGNVNFNMEI